MPNHVSRWGGNIGQWNQNIIDVQEFGALRADTVFNHVGNYFGLYESANLNVSAVPSNGGTVSVSGLIIPENPWTGEYFNSNYAFIVPKLPYEDSLDGMKVGVAISPPYDNLKTDITYNSLETYNEHNGKLIVNKKDKKKVQDALNKSFKEKITTVIDARIDAKIYQDNFGLTIGD